MVRAPLRWIDYKNSKMPSPMRHATFGLESGWIGT